MTRPTPTETELSLGFHPLQYEIDMLEFCATKLLGATQLEPNEKNAYLESFAIHARALYEFFFKGDSDFCASDYFTDPIDWKKLRKRDGLEQVWDQTGSQIAHITGCRLRLTPEAKSWDVGVILEAFRKTIKDFHAHRRSDILHVPAPAERPPSSGVATGMDSKIASSITTSADSAPVSLANVVRSSELW